MVDSGKHTANYSIASKKFEGSLFLTCNATQENSSNFWLIDSGCSNHMMGNKGLITNLDDSVKIEVKFGTDNVIKVIGKGMVNILTKQKQKRHIPDVYYALGLKHNIISVGQLTQKGYNVIFKGDDCIIYDKPPNKRLIAKIKMTKNRTYPIFMNYGSQDVSFAKKATCMDDFWLCHFRFGHLHFGGLKLLQEKKMVEEFPPIQETTNTCEGCMLAT